MGKKVIEETPIVQDAVNKIIWNVKDRNDSEECSLF